jgi:hypothetical protein
LAVCPPCGTVVVVVTIVTSQLCTGMLFVFVLLLYERRHNPYLSARVLPLLRRISSSIRLFSSIKQFKNYTTYVVRYLDFADSKNLDFTGLSHLKTEAHTNSI